MKGRTSVTRSDRLGNQFDVPQLPFFFPCVCKCVSVFSVCPLRVSFFLLRATLARVFLLFCCFGCCALPRNPDAGRPQQTHGLLPNQAGAIKHLLVSPVLSLAPQKPRVQFAAFARPPVTSVRYVSGPMCASLRKIFLRAPRLRLPKCPPKGAPRAQTPPRRAPADPPGAGRPSPAAEGRDRSRRPRRLSRCCQVNRTADLDRRRWILCMCCCAVSCLQLMVLLCVCVFLSGVSPLAQICP